MPAAQLLLVVAWQSKHGLFLCEHAAEIPGL
jgi:hypothetical protein